VRSAHLARGLISAVLAVILLSLACGGSNTRGPSNLTAEQRARLQDFAEKVEGEGYLRPALPAYVPPGLDPSPEIMDKSDQHIVFQFLPTPSEPSERTAVPLFLVIGQQFDPRACHSSAGTSPTWGAMTPWALAQALNVCGWMDIRPTFKPQSSPAARWIITSHLSWATWTSSWVSSGREARTPLVKRKSR
jgi:hypothetical protein